jgi:protein-tyrosine phosphatase
MHRRINVLFVCGRNQWRSRTAETIYRDHALLNVKSAGTENSARIKVNEKLVGWAEVIFVMEKRHGDLLSIMFPQMNARVITLDISDEYKYMDKELIAMLDCCVDEYLKSNYIEKS